MKPGENTGEGPDEVELLRREARALSMPGEIDPAAVGITLPSAQQMLARAKARSELDDTAAAAEPGAPAPSATSLSSRRRRTALRLGSVAAAIAGLVLVSLSPWHRDTATAAKPPVLDYEFANAQNIAYAPGQDAHDTLLRLSQAASRQVAKPATGDAQYVLTDNWFVSLSDTEEPQLIPRQRQFWLRADGSVRIRETSGRPLSPDGRGLRRAVPDQTGNTADETYPPGDADPRFVAELGIDPTAIRETLLDRSECQSRRPSPTRASCLFREISDLFGQYVVPASTAGALWRVLADEPSVRTLGTVEDRAGRRGVGISLIPVDAPRFRSVLIISPTTGELLGTEDILIKDYPDAGVEAPAIYSFTAILESRYVTEPQPGSASSRQQ
jgi:hypothetical protein